MSRVTAATSRLQAQGVTVAGTAAKVQAAGALVTVNATSTGDVSIGGAQVAFNGSVGGDLKAAGAVVDVTGNVIGNADIGGAVAKVGLTTGGHLFVGGASITVAPWYDVRGEMQVLWRSCGHQWPRWRPGTGRRCGGHL